jgi:hypothetical protein
MLNIKFICIILALSFLATSLLFAQGDPYTWPAYSPTLDYNFKRDNPNLAMPTKDLDDCSGVVGTQSSDWWTFKWGATKNSVVTASAITPLLARMNKDFAYFRDTMGWPPDKRAQNGYRSAIYLYGSSLCTDNKPNTELGGWQSAIGAYPMVLLSYYPVYSFDPQCTYSDRESQMSACVHEGIHSVLANLPGAKKAAWFQEGGNTWLQQQASAQQSNDFSSMGFLNVCPLIAPFMPIECYSGWLQDGSFGGPSAEGVDTTNPSGEQVCTWRKTLGGTQYGSLFPTFLGEWLGLGSVPWIWKNCTERVLEGMGATLGDVQIRRLISEYRARLALLDMKEWSTACKNLIDDNFGSSIGAEWAPYKVNCAVWKATPYAITTNDGSGLLTPENRTTPGWSGANLIPLKVAGTIATVDFQPIGANMTCQLCYRATDGTPVYSTIVSTGTCSLRLDKAPAGGVVIAVICNTDYKYLGDDTRKTHYDYKLKIGSEMTTADVNTKWYNVKLTTGTTTPTNPSAMQSSRDFNFSLENRSAIVVNYKLTNATTATVSLYTAYGALVRHLSSSRKQAGTYSEKFDVSSLGISNGTYLIKLKTSAGSFTGSLTLVN